MTVDLIEAKARLERLLGSGITLQGNALRVLRELGRVGHRCQESGYAFDSVGLATPDGTRVPRSAGHAVPAARICPRPSACGGPRLQRDPDARRSGPSGAIGPARYHRRRCWTRTATASTVRFSDGTEGRYDLVIAADGLDLRPPAR
ncbi:2-polyprenyl-6-methoxyphenol hydroxylase OS=Streptomyces alboniger OX=132473 GN=CP975_21805 PE=4 SV=1 [Streptomyces alboniger]